MSQGAVCIRDAANSTKVHTAFVEPVWEQGAARLTELKNVASLLPNEFTGEAGAQGLPPPSVAIEAKVKVNGGASVTLGFLLAQKQGKVLSGYYCALFGAYDVKHVVLRVLAERMKRATEGSEFTGASVQCKLEWKHNLGIPMYASGPGWTKGNKTLETRNDVPQFLEANRVLCLLGFEDVDGLGSFEFPPPPPNGGGGATARRRLLKALTTKLLYLYTRNDEQRWNGRVYKGTPDAELPEPLKQTMELPVLLKTVGLRVFDVGHDGSCLFHSLAAWVDGRYDQTPHLYDPTSNPKLRSLFRSLFERLETRMLRKDEDYLSRHIFAVASLNPQANIQDISFRRAWTELKKEMEPNSSTFGTELHIRTLSFIYNRPVMIFSFNLKKYIPKSLYDPQKLGQHEVSPRLATPLFMHETRDQWESFRSAPPIMILHIGEHYEIVASETIVPVEQQHTLKINWEPHSGPIAAASAVDKPNKPNPPAVMILGEPGGSQADPVQILDDDGPGGSEADPIHSSDDDDSDIDTESEEQNEDDTESDSD